uniref:Uncharacterized protein n=1 Tax=viral metagenome TaxID=1070528 RepID=A0A6C0EJH2_9ZZZZ
MRLRLKNFRCYLDKEFDFGNDGMLLLSGPSGSGKTTILSAINFALYGTGTKLVTFGKTSCRVELTFDELQIIRTKRPNRVVVTNLRTNEEYEDAAAQSIINERFGTTFDVTSYVQQNAYRSFIMMSPLEKLGFLEKFAFNGIDLGKIKARCKAITQKRNEDLISVTSQLEMATQHLESLSKPIKVLFPLKAKNKEKAIKNELVRLKNSKILIKRVQKRVDSLRKEENALKIFLTKLEANQSAIDRIEKKLTPLQSELDSLDYEGDEKLYEYEKLLQSVMAHRELDIMRDKYSQDKVRLEEMESDEIDRMKNEISSLKKKLWGEHTEEETKEMLSDYKQIVKDAERYERLKSNLTKYEVDEERLSNDKLELEKSRNTLDEKKARLSRLLLQQELYTCPSCEASLRFQNNELHLFDNEIEDEDEDIDDVKRDISRLNRTINRLECQVPDIESRLKRRKEIQKEIRNIESQYEEELPTKDDAEEIVEDLTEYKRTQCELEKKIKKLEVNIRDKNYSGSFTMMKNSLEQQRTKIKTLRKKLKEASNADSIDEQELRKTIEIQRRNKERMAECKKRVRTLCAELKEYKELIVTNEDTYVKEYGPVRDLDEIELELANETEELEKLYADSSRYAENVANIDRYKHYREELARYREWVDKVENLKEEEKDCRSRYAASTLLKDKILQAESIAIMNIIDSINAHAQEYLDIFFPSDPIVVRLLPFKQTKKSTKPQINLQIDYKGMEADINMLSGGELSRVVLAYTLALAEIFNSPMLLLDECTASIDQGLTEVVIGGIRNNFGNRIVIVIAHQVTTGVFDRVLEI